MPAARVNGVELYYELHGTSGEPLVFVHGYTGDISDWRFQIPEFSKTHRVLVVDNRGHGRSAAPTDRACYSVLDIADDIEALIEHVRFGQYHLVGHSMGGAVAQEIALRNPHRLLSLTLHDTSHRFSSGGSSAVSAYGLFRVKMAEEQGMKAVAAMPALTPPPPYMQAERQLEMQQRLGAMSVDAFIGAWCGLQEWRGTTGRLHHIVTPALVVCGELDAEPLVRASQHLAESIQEAVLELIPDAAHSPQYERPEIFNAALLRHLQRNVATTAMA